MKTICLACKQDERATPTEETRALGASDPRYGQCTHAPWLRSTTHIATPIPFRSTSMALPTPKSPPFDDTREAVDKDKVRDAALPNPTDNAASAGASKDGSAMTGAPIDPALVHGSDADAGSAASHERSDATKVRGVAQKPPHAG